MLNKFLLFFFLTSCGFVFSQDDYPTDYFVNPLEIPLVLSGAFSSALAETADQRPNFLIIVADDLGWSDISSFGRFYCGSHKHI